MWWTLDYGVLEVLFQPWLHLTLLITPALNQAMYVYFCGVLTQYVFFFTFLTITTFTATGLHCSTSFETRVKCISALRGSANHVSATLRQEERDSLCSLAKTFSDLSHNGSWWERGFKRVIRVPCESKPLVWVERCFQDYIASPVAFVYNSRTLVIQHKMVSYITAAHQLLCVSLTLWAPLILYYSLNRHCKDTFGVELTQLNC